MFAVATVGDAAVAGSTARREPSGAVVGLIQRQDGEAEFRYAGPTHEPSTPGVLYRVYPDEDSDGGRYEEHYNPPGTASGVETGMHVGMYHESAGSRHAGGVAMFLQEMAAAMSTRHEVTLYTGPGDRTRILRESAVRVVTVPPVGERELLALVLERATPLRGQQVPKLCTFLGARRHGVLDRIDREVDVLLTSQYLDDLLVSNAVDVPTVYQYHGLESAGLGASARERLSDALLHLANSRATAAEVRAAFGREVDGVVSPGVDTTAFSPDAAPAFVDRSPTVLFVGRLVEEKGVSDLIEALAASPTDARLRVVGRGDPDPFRRRAAALGVADAVTWEGTVPHEDLPGYYAAADVVCSPSHYESFGMVNLEAMACGAAVVTSDLPGPREYVTDGENGLLVPPKDVSTLAERLGSLLSSPARRARLGSAARETASGYDWSRQAERLAEFCRQAIERAPR